MPPDLQPSRADNPSPCTSCGACCSYSPDWPRFSLEEESDLARIPLALVKADGSGMRCDGDRCAALTGKVGVKTSCGIYQMRPIVCRACEPGDEECTTARQRFGMSPLPL